jgi:hypothetical protein
MLDVALVPSLDVILFEVNPTALAAAAGTLLSLLFSYVPGFREWFDGLGRNPESAVDQGTHKRLVMLFLLCLVTTGAILLACGSGKSAGFPAPERTGLVTPVQLCGKAGIWDIVQSLIAAITANQAMYSLSPRRRKIENNAL